MFWGDNHVDYEYEAIDTVSRLDTENVPGLYLNNAKRDFQRYITILVTLCQKCIGRVTDAGNTLIIHLFYYT